MTFILSVHCHPHSTICRLLLYIQYVFIIVRRVSDATFLYFQDRNNNNLNIPYIELNTQKSIERWGLVAHVVLYRDQGKEKRKVTTMVPFKQSFSCLEDLTQVSFI